MQMGHLKLYKAQELISLDPCIKGCQIIGRKYQLLGKEHKWKYALCLLQLLQTSMMYLLKDLNPFNANFFVRLLDTSATNLEWTYFLQA